MNPHPYVDIDSVMLKVVVFLMVLGLAWLVLA